MQTILTNPHPIKSITELHKLAGGPAPEHPLVSLVKLEDIPPLPEGYPRSFIYEFFSIGFKKNLKGYVDYGRQRYDFQEGVLGFTAPHQALSFTNSDASEATGWLLFFHKELLLKSDLTQKIEDYGFFSYAVNEALHMSEKEESVIEGTFRNMYDEYTQPIDRFSKNVLISNLELLLTYSERFYSRQFITRNEVDSSFHDRFQKELKAYFKTESLAQHGLPSASYFADRLHITTNYLSDLLRAITGKTTSEHIHFKVIELAKEKLLGTDLSISQIAYSLGFEYPQYFNRLFKEKTGQTPKEYRVADYQGFKTNN